MDVNTHTRSKGSGVDAVIPVLRRSCVHSQYIRPEGNFMKRSRASFWNVIERHHTKRPEPTGLAGSSRCESTTVAAPRDSAPMATQSRERAAGAPTAKKDTCGRPRSLPAPSEHWVVRAPLTARHNPAGNLYFVLVLSCHRPFQRVAARSRDSRKREEGGRFEKRCSFAGDKCRRPFLGQCFASNPR